MTPTFESAPQPIRVLLADDYPLLRFGLSALIGQDQALFVCGTADTPGATLGAIETFHPHVVILAFPLRSAETLALIREARRRHARTALLIVSFKNEPSLAKRASQAGAQGFVARADAAECVVEAIHRIAQGATYVGPTTRSALADQMFDPASPATPPDGIPFTDREREILEQLGGGSTPREIAAALGVSIKTVESHRENIKEKLGIKTAAKLALFAFQWLQGHRPP